MKVAYIYDINNTGSYAAKTVSNGFKNAFKARGDEFSFFDITKLTPRLWPTEKRSLLNFAPDVIFTSVENISKIALNRLKPTTLVLWGEFYAPCSYEAQIQTIKEETKQLLNKYSDKHNIIIWSQHDEEINDRFFGGYQKELGLKFIQLLHCADQTRYTAPVLNPEFDFLWVGNIGHRMETYNSFIAPLKTHFSNYLEYTEHNMINPEKLEADQLYSRSFVAPNIHTPAQIEHKILVNERVFTSTMLGGFQICDNQLAKKYFSEDELVIVSNGADLMDKAIYYHSQPAKRLEMIEKMQANILKNHTYFNRIDALLAIV